MLEEMNPMPMLDQMSMSFEHMNIPELNSYVDVKQHGYIAGISHNLGGGSGGFKLEPELCQSRFSQLFSLEQIACICKTLYYTKDGDRLTTLFESDQNLLQYRNNSNYVLIAFFYVLYHSQRYQDLFDGLKNIRNVADKYHDILQNLWYEGHYALEEQKKTKNLGPVERYRLRGKHRPPKSIWDGEKIIYTFKESVRLQMIEFYKKDKYPKPEQKQIISKKTGLTAQQIANWFKNRRQRDKPTRICDIAPDQRQIFQPIDQYHYF